MLLEELKAIARSNLFGFYCNVNKTKYKRNVLLSYITYPYRKGVLKTHSNFLEVHELLRIFMDLGYNVDLANYYYNGKIDYTKYDLIFGFGEPFGKAFWTDKSKNALKVCYLTGALALFNQMERNKYLKERKGKNVIPRRDYYHKYLLESVSMSDAIICTGNEWTASTIRPYNSRVYPVRLPIFLPDKGKVINIINKKDFERAKKNFLWFGSFGALHKGLDLCLDVFANNKNLFLHVCGHVEKEEDFFELYKKELTQSINIKYYGFVNIDSTLFEDIIQSCAFVIFPSCSEGGGGSLLTGMSYGLIPIATVESGVNIEKSYGILLNSYKIEHIEEVVKELSSANSDELRDKAFNTVNYVFNNHSVSHYREDILNAFKKLGIAQ